MKNTTAVHEAYERQFWGKGWLCRRRTTLPRMSLLQRRPRQRLLRDSDRLAKCHSLKEGLFTTERQKTILDGFVRVFDAYQMDPTAVEHGATACL